MKGLFVVVLAVLVTLQQCDALKCYSCLDACEYSADKTKVCGSTIGDSQEAVCTTEIAKESKTPKVAIRKCQIVQKGQEPKCSTDSVCTSCKSELCNSAPSTGVSAALMGAMVTVFFAKFLLN